MAIRLRLARSAEDDLRRIFVTTLADFGQAALVRYRALIGTALQDLQQNQAPPGSRERPDLGAEIRSYHLRLCRVRASVEGQRVAKPRHLLVYQAKMDETIVLRVLHDAMEVSRHLPGV